MLFRNNKIFIFYISPFLVFKGYKLILFFIGLFFTYSAYFFNKKYPYYFKTYKVYSLKKYLPLNDIERYIIQGYLDPLEFIDKEVFLLFNNYSEIQNIKFNERDIKFYIISDDEKYFIDSNNICYHKNKEKYFLINEIIFNKISES